MIQTSLKLVETPCAWCSEPATLLCDFVVGIERAADGAYGLGAEAWTCDAPMCQLHGRLIGHMGGERLKDHDTIDRCPHHVEDFSAFPDGATTEEEASKVRRDVLAAARRYQFRIVPPTT